MYTQLGFYNHQQLGSDKAKKRFFCILNITQDEPTSSTAPWAAGRCCRLYHSDLTAAELQHKMIVSLSGIIINILLHWCSFHSISFQMMMFLLSCPDKECTRCAISLECLQMMFPSSNKGLCGYLKRPPTWVRIHMIHVGTRLFGSVFWGCSWFIPIRLCCIHARELFNTFTSLRSVVCPKNIKKQISKEYIFYHILTFFLTF